MNNRWNELIRQAIDEIGPEDRPSKEETLRRYAELIVQECAKVINADIEFQIKDGVISNVHGLNQARELIKEHFGME